MQMLKIFQIIIWITLAIPLYADDVQLAWDASTTAEVNGYRIYVGNAPRIYDRTFEAGNVLTYTVLSVPSGTYYFAVTALVPEDAPYERKESDYSNEVALWIAPHVSCDVNGDASINVLDLQLMANMVAGIIPINLLFDLNQDGLLNVLDLQILANVVAGIRTCP